MLLEPNGILLKDDSSRDPAGGVLRWVDDIDTASPTSYWALSRDESDDSFALGNETANDTTTPLRVTTDDTVEVADLDVRGSVTSLHVSGTSTRVSGFDTNDEHWLHQNANGGSPILGIRRHANSDYSLLVSQGDQDERLLHTGDAIDADTLDGVAPTALVHADGSVGLTDNLPVGANSLTGGGARIDFKAAGGHNSLVTDGETGGWEVWSQANQFATVRFEESGDARYPNGTIYQQGNRVLDTGDDRLGFDAENTNGTTLVEGVDAVAAGTDLAFSDDGDDTVTLSFTGTTSLPSGSVGDTATASGDGSTTTFSLAHSLGEAPSSVDVTATSRAASTDFWVSNVTDSAVEVTYATAPPSGSDNLSWHLTATSSGFKATTVSDDGTQILSSPDDLNFNGDLTVQDDGDNTVTVGVANTVASVGETETITASWQFDAGVGVGADTDLALTNTSQTTQFAWRYDSTNDRAVFADRVNATDAVEVDRSGVVNFPENAQIGGTDIATADADLANSGSGSAPAEAVPEADGNGNITWTRRTDASAATASGDGSTTTFTFAHNLGAAPTAAFVQPESKAAMSDFRVTDKTSSAVTIEYHSAPPEGTDNLHYTIIAHE